MFNIVQTNHFTSRIFHQIQLICTQLMNLFKRISTVFENAAKENFDGLREQAFKNLTDRLNIRALRTAEIIKENLLAYPSDGYLIDDDLICLEYGNSHDLLLSLDDFSYAIENYILIKSMQNFNFDDKKLLSFAEYELKKEILKAIPDSSYTQNRISLITKKVKGISQKRLNAYCTDGLVHQFNFN